MATTVIAAAAARAEREIVDYLRRNRATTPEQAIALSELPHLGRRRLRRLLHAQVVRESGSGYWLDETIYESYRSDRRALLIALLVAIVAVLIAVALAQRA
jgi:hypothetical protein